MKIISILSGGMDSTTMTYSFLKEKNEVKAITFDYGQRHKKEIEYAKRFCNDFKIEQKIINLNSITQCLERSALTSNIEIPEGHYQDQNMRSTVVPNRNMIMASIAAAWAISIKYDAIALGVHSGDHAIYPDCRLEFINALSYAILIGNYEKLYVLTPLLNFDKRNIAKIGLDMGLNYDEYTWTCYKGLDQPCGKCGSCIEREEALSDK